MKSKRFLISNIISKKNKINIQNNNNNSNVTIFNNNNFVINDKDIEEDNISTINPIMSMFAMSSYVCPSGKQRSTQIFFLYSLFHT